MELNQIVTPRPDKFGRDTYRISGNLFFIVQLNSMPGASKAIHRMFHFQTGEIRDNYEYCFMPVLEKGKKVYRKQNENIHSTTH